MSFAKSFKASRNLKLDSNNFAPAITHNLENPMEVLTTASEDFLKSKENGLETVLEPDSSSTTASTSSSKSQYITQIKKGTLQIKKSAFLPKTLSHDFRSHAIQSDPFRNLGFGSMGQEFEENYEIVGVLGKGHQGTVVKVKDTKTSEYMAAKILNQKEDEEMNMNLKNEYALLSSLNHPNIVKVKSLITSNKNSSIMMMEFLDSYVSLKTFVENNLQLSQTQIIAILTQIASAVSYLHEKKIVHRDLHISNVLIHESTLQIKIIDFGLAKRVYIAHKSYDSLWNIAQKLQEDEFCDFDTPTGLPSFRAPEILSHGSYSYKVDVWMIGLILFALINKEYLTTMSVLKRMKNGDDKFNNQDFEMEIKMALVGCLKRNPFERLSSKELLGLLSLLNQQ